MARPATPLPCPECEGLRTRKTDTRIDPDPPAGAPTVLRLRVCLDCGAVLGSREQLHPADEVRRRLGELARERMGDLRAVRKALAPPPATA